MSLISISPPPPPPPEEVAPIQNYVWLCFILSIQYQEYEYEDSMEAIYNVSLLKTFKKTIEDGFFDFIIVDAINDKITKVEPFWTYAKLKGFEVSVI